MSLLYSAEEAEHGIFATKMKTSMRTFYFGSSGNYVVIVVVENGDLYINGYIYMFMFNVYCVAINDS